ncbi:MAG: tRNA pseudouridine(38-40) synthase TruA [Candidatus Krumholzibacteria bacterium]|nr:tRNA pseudouridine(38-40) synthase TruA [Candidatus Krumholzibacteria bacterium]MDH4336548.1 tRNA pseudouridine(38-40) synthase TruA [Candidatus Krumholzibacteria bacterium]MDH5269629.1 tRNA pseudouridine(38-40) synthase TruA [Candidatus Krumholzibacteria bacterium]
MSVRNIRLLLEYDGTDFSGWQKQPDVRTVQGTVEAAIATVCRQLVGVRGCARTDAGVHALGYVANFHVESEHTTSRLVIALNACLPDDVAVVGAMEVADDFHARFSAQSRRYVYRIATTPTAIWRRFSYHTHHYLDVERMRAAARHLQGRQDFTSFTPVTNDKDPVCNLMDVTVVGAERHILIEVESDRFLYNMVRAIAGTLMEVGRGKIEPERMPEILGKRDRRAAGPTAAACGLTLLRARYPGDPGERTAGSA